MFLLGILTVETIIIVLQIFRKKMYKSVIVILLWYAINTFYTPALYYTLFHGESYKKFSNYDYKLYLIIGSCYLLVLIIFNLIFYNRRVSVLDLKINTIKCRNWAKALGITIILFIIFYILIYRSNFPLLYQLLYGKVMDAIERPDVSGSIPFYFTISTIICTFTPML